MKLKITLISPRDIVVEWTDPAPAAGHIVEWGTSDSPDEPWVPLGFFPSGQRNSYKHPDLMWDMNSYYRLRGYYGPATPEVEISLPKELTDAEYTKRYAEPEEYHWAPPMTIPDEKPVEKKSIRNAATAAEGAPTNFKITLQPVSVSGFKLTWTDHASDEDGFMIELKPEGASEFRVVAITPPDINSFGWAFEPPARKGTMRVRAYYLGNPTAALHERTGPEPVEKTPETKPVENSPSAKAVPMPKPAK